MVNPQTVNVGIIVPLTGADVDLWGEVDVNPNMVAIDALFSGIQTIAVASAGLVTLTAPAGFTATPTPGPTQSQNRVLRFTGALTLNVQITLPLPGVYVIENLTTNNFILQFRAVGVGEVISIEQGGRQTIYNDGTNVRYVDMPRVGTLEFWAGISAMPAWAVNCSVVPFLLCDGAVSNFSQFPYLAQRLGGAFGGNGVTTFATPDMRGRYPLAYDGTGARVTVAGCGINGQTMGAALDAQTVTLTSSQMPVHFHGAVILDNGHTHSNNGTGVGSSGTGGGGFSIAGFGSVTINSAVTGVRVNSANGIDTTASAGAGAAHNNMPNTQVAGIWVIKT